MEKHNEHIEKGKYTKEQLKVSAQGWLFYDAPYKCARAIAKRSIGDKILDIGGGSGIMAGIVKAVTNKSVFVTEADTSVIADCEYDMTYTSHVLEHVEDPLKLVDESIRLASQRIIHIVPEGYAEDINLGTHHRHVFNRQNFYSLLATACDKFKGTEVVEVEVIQDYHINSLIGVIIKK